jgi:hypothetical protein
MFKLDAAVRIEISRCGCQLARALVLVCTLFALGHGVSFGQIIHSRANLVRTVEESGVVKWESNPNSLRPRFFDVFSMLTGVALPADPSQLPFGRSVAFLIGVGVYTHQDPLPGATQSVRQLRDYLLSDGGFDLVYEISDSGVMRNPSASPAMVRDFMRNRLISLGRADRLLFYFAGHGTDRNATTGYLLFRGASKSKMDEDYLATNEIREWSELIPARHILFLLDACSAGYGFDVVPQGNDLAARV